MFNTILETSFLNNTAQDYLIFIAAFIAGIIILKIFKGVVEKRLKIWTERTSTTIDDFLIRTVEKQMIPLLYFASLYMATGFLSLTPEVSRYFNTVGVIVVTYFGLRLLISLFNYSLETYWLKKEVDKTRQKSLTGIFNIFRFIIWSIGITFLLDNLGFEISTVVAGLGIGGIAVALAAQTILGDLFSYFVIFLDKPFEIGDFIIIDSYMGSIEHIGIKTTRVRSLGGEQLVFSNTDLTNSRIRNYKRMQKRRIVFKLGVIYQTTSEQAKAIPEIIKGVINNIQDAVYDRAHFLAFGDFSLDYEIVYNVLSSDYNKYMDIQQEINFALKDEFEKQGIEFAYPTQTLFVEKPAEN